MQAEPPFMPQAPLLLSPHATLNKFGYPHNLLHEGRHWALLVRPAQPTLGSLVLCAREDVRSFGEMTAEAFAEQGELVARIERFLHDVTAYEKINYLMLMMVDPQVHFHIIPRYPGERLFEGVAYLDSGWPGFPDLGSSVPASELLVSTLQRGWAETSLF